MLQSYKWRKKCAYCIVKVRAHQNIFQEIFQTENHGDAYFEMPVVVLINML